MNSEFIIIIIIGLNIVNFFDRFSCRLDLPLARQKWTATLIFLKLCMKTIKNVTELASGYCPVIHAEMCELI